MGLLVSEGLLPGVILTATRTVRFQFNCQGSNTEAGVVLYMVVPQEPKTILGIFIWPSCQICTARQSPCQKLYIVLQLCTVTPPLVREWPSVLHD